MYKNFKITEKEKKQIMKMHESHGYKPVMNEQGETSTEGGAFSIDPKVYIVTNTFYVDVISNENETPISVSVSVKNNIEGTEITNIEIISYVDETINQEEVMGYVKSQLTEMLPNIPEGVLVDINTGEMST